MSARIEVTADPTACLELRRIVFIEEQGVSAADERDGREDEAIHLLARVDGVPVGAARILVLGSVGKIGRVCVLASHRGTGLGKALIARALDELAAMPEVVQARLGAQTHATGFYEKLGFVAEGDEFLDAGIPHREMVLTLRRPDARPA